jgi:hypothetical protein
VSARRPLAAVELGDWRGLREADVDAAVVEAALRGHEGRGDERGRRLLKSDRRSLVTAVRTPGPAVVVKEVRKGGIRRRLADLFRGTPARRAFAAGRRLAALGIGAARPLAYLEQRRLGLPRRSLLVSLDLSEWPTADRALASDPSVLERLAELAVSLHREGVRHGDLRAQHVHIAPGGTPLLIDLEAVRFRRSATDAERIEDLAQLDASIADPLASPRDRREAFLRYARSLPFRASEDEVLRRIRARSVSRGRPLPATGAP